MEEIWKDIKDYEGIYQISNLGRVKSMPRKIIYKDKKHYKILPERVMSWCDNGNGYKCVYLKKNGKRKIAYIHRLVANAFIENKENKKYINHKDYNPCNNRFDNLEWCSQKENVIYSSERMKKAHKSNGNSTGSQYITLKKYNRYQLAMKGKYIGCFGSLKEAIKKRDELIRGDEYYVCVFGK